MPELTFDCSYFGAVEQFFEERTDKLITFSVSTSLWALSLFFPLIFFRVEVTYEIMKGFSVFFWQGKQGEGKEY